MRQFDADAIQGRIKIAAPGVGSSNRLRSFALRQALTCTALRLAPQSRRRQGAHFDGHPADMRPSIIQRELPISPWRPPAAGAAGSSHTGPYRQPATCR
jgi:hypothetical protein